MLASCLVAAIALSEGPTPARSAFRPPAPPAEALVFPARAAGIGPPAAIAGDAGGVVYLAAPAVKSVFRISTPGQLSLIAGGEQPTFAPPPGRDPAPRRISPVGLAVDASTVFVVDDTSGAILRVDARTGATTTVLRSASSDPAEGTNGQQRSAVERNGTTVVRPWGLALDAAGRLYVSDRARDAVFRVTLPATTIERVAGSRMPGYSGDGGPAAQARLSAPEGIALDRAGNLFIADRGNHCVRRVDGRTGLITTVAGTGFPGSSGDGGRAGSAELHDPAAVAIDTDGDLFIADLGNGRVRRVDARKSVIETVRGLENVSSRALACLRDGSLLVGDLDRWMVLERARTGVVRAIAGNGSLGFTGDGGPATSAHLVRPAGLARDGAGNLHVVDVDGNRVRRIDAHSGIISTVAGSGRRGFSGDGGPATQAALDRPQAIAFDRDGRLLIADAGNNRLRRVAADGTIATVAGTGRDGRASDGAPALATDLGRCRGVAVDSTGAILVLQGQYGLVHRIDENGILHTIVGSRQATPLSEGQPAASGRVGRISAFAVGPADDLLFFDEVSLQLWRVDGSSHVARVLAGRGLSGTLGPGDEARGASLGSVLSIAWSGAGTACVGEAGGGIRCIERAPPHRTTPRGDAQQIRAPAGLLFAADEVLYAADEAGRIWKLEADGAPIAVAGGGPGF